MAEYDNPAGRLHERLSRFTERAGNNILDAWAHALEVSPDEVPRYLGQLMDLLEQTKRVSAATGERSFEDLPGRLDAIKTTIFPAQQAFQGPPANSVHGVVPDAITMKMLDMLSKHLSQYAPEPLPEDNDVETLIAAVKELIDDVEDADIPLDVKQALLNKLTDVLIALQHLRTQGPAAVKSAAVALAGSAVFYEKQSGNPSLLHRIMTVAAVVGLVFSHGVDIQSNAQAWNQLLRGHISIPAQVEPLQLLSGEKADGQVVIDGKVVTLEVGPSPTDEPYTVP